MDFDPHPPLHPPHSDERSSYMHSQPERPYYGQQQLGMSSPLKSTDFVGSGHGSSIPYHPPTLPEVGQTRCYWTLLSSSLQFLVLDPVLAYHLQDQATAILDSSLLDFVHPDEQASARQDLGGVLEAKTLHGSITRVRFCRLSRVRRLLGLMPSETTPLYPASFPAERIAIDSNYMAVDIVLNFVAEGLVLCFIHAVVDIMPEEDNDERRRTGWSNWCSTYGFGDEQAHAMYQCLCERVPLSNQQSLESSLRMLQILRNEPQRTLLVSWPPDPHYADQQYSAVPSASDLAQLVKHVKIDAGGGEARTSCTRRFKSSRFLNIQVYGAIKGVEVESIFIPHGSVIFACHKINGVRPSNVVSYGSGPNNSAYPNGHQNYPYTYVPPADGRAYDSNNDSTMYGMPYLDEQIASDQTYVQRWVEGQSQETLPPPEDQWATAPPHNSESTSASAMSSPALSPPHTRTMESDGGPPQSYYPYPHQHQAPQGWGPTPSHHPSNYVSAQADSTRAESPGFTNYAGDVSSGAPLGTPGSEDTPFGSREDSKGDIAPTIRIPYRPRVPRRPAGAGTAASGAEDDEPYMTPGRSSADSLPDTLKCTSCGATHSPEWRKGPSGKKDLCNACGLRFARSRAKKEGVSARRRPGGKQAGGASARQASSMSVGPSSASSSRRGGERSRVARLTTNHAVQRHPPSGHEPRAVAAQPHNFASTLLDASYLVSLANSAPAPSRPTPSATATATAMGDDVPIDPSLAAESMSSPSPPTSGSGGGISSATTLTSATTTSININNTHHQTSASHRHGQPFTPPDSAYGLPIPSPKYGQGISSGPSLGLDNHGSRIGQAGVGVDSQASLHLPPTPLSSDHSFARQNSSYIRGVLADGPMTAASGTNEYGW